MISWSAVDGARRWANEAKFESRMKVTERRGGSAGE